MLIASKRKTSKNFPQLKWRSYTLTKTWRKEEKDCFGSRSRKQKISNASTSGPTTDRSTREKLMTRTEFMSKLKMIWIICSSVSKFWLQWLCTLFFGHTSSLNSQIGNIYDNCTSKYKTLERFSEEMISNLANDQIFVVHISIASLNKNFDALTHFLHWFPKPVEVICLSETRLNDRNLKYNNLLGYKFLCSNSSTKAGGSAIYESDKLNCIELALTKLKWDGCESVWIELKLNNNEALIVDSVCRHPKNVIRKFGEAFISIIKSFKINQNFIVLGDFNINYDKLPLS